MVRTISNRSAERRGARGETARSKARAASAKAIPARKPRTSQTRPARPAVAALSEANRKRFHIWWSKEFDDRFLAACSRDGWKSRTGRIESLAREWVERNERKHGIA